jgi:phage baseplate assembly protein W
MSYSFKIADGDLVARGNQLGLVFGVDKLKQDVDMWLRERYGGDRFHVTMGSILQDFIGDVVSGSTRAEIHAEVLRVLQNYQAVQLRRLHESPQLLSSSELLVSVDDIVTGVSYDTVRVTIKLRNGSDQATTIRVAASL